MLSKKKTHLKFIQVRPRLFNPLLFLFSGYSSLIFLHALNKNQRAKAKCYYYFFELNVKLYSKRKKKTVSIQHLSESFLSSKLKRAKCY